MDNLEGYSEFYRALPVVKLTKGKAKDVPADQFEKINKLMEEKDKELKIFMKQAAEKDEAAMKKLAEMQAKHDKQIDELKRQSGSWFDIVSGLIPLGAAVIKAI